MSENMYRGRVVKGACCRGRIDVVSSKTEAVTDDVFLSRTSGRRRSSVDAVHARVDVRLSAPHRRVHLRETLCHQVSIC